MPENSGSAVAVSARLERIEREVVDVFVRLAEVAGLPRSVGELYGCLFICPDPLPMDALMERLHLSKGAVSQGLRLLRSFGAVRTVYVPGDRRDHFTAECELRKLVSGYLQEKLVPHLRSGDERLKVIRALLAETNGSVRRALQERVAQLSRWHRRAEQIIPLLLRMLQQ